MAELGELEKVDLRSQWLNGEKDFIPDLADNLDLLSDAIGMDLELKDTDVQVGSFSADLVARPIQEGLGPVVVECQFGKSDHDHLGKIITYGSGLEASYVIWICEKIRDEHRTAINWLNDNFTRDVGFLALEIELLRIGDSPLAPKLNVIVKPDEWRKIAKSVAEKELTETQRLQWEFWNGLKEYMEGKTNLSLRRTLPQHWYSFAVGRAGFNIGLTVNTKKDKIGCELYIWKKGTEAINALEKDRRELEEELGELEWLQLEKKKASRIIQYKDFDLYNEDEWEKAFHWLKDRAERFYEVFSPRVKELEI